MVFLVFLVIFDVFLVFLPKPFVFFGFFGLWPGKQRLGAPGRHATGWVDGGPEARFPLELWFFWFFWLSSMHFWFFG